jgi:oligoendopeptidase F
MSETTILTHREVDRRYTWNAESVFASPAAWEAELNAVATDLDELRRFQGRLSEGPAVLATAMELLELLLRRAGIVYIYAFMSHQVEVDNSQATGAFGRAQGLLGQLLTATAFVDPELLVIGEETLSRWMQEEPRLAKLEHYLHNLFRRQAHVRSAEVEELLGMLTDPFGGAQATAGILTNAELKFEPAITEGGTSLPLTQGTLHKILSGPDRTARRTAWEHYADAHLAVKNTLANLLITSVKQNVFSARARRYPTTLEAALFENDIPVAVFHNLIETFRQNLPTWHRYWALRRKALGVETLHTYDIWAPLTSQTPPVVPYEQAVAWICAGLAPLGESYVETLRRGALEQRWVDVYPTQGKRSGAFSAGWPGTYPFILLNYNDNVPSLSTLAHELGHSMHSYLTWETQPMLYSQYSLFAAEVASNFHQAMVRAYLLEHQTDPAFQLAVLEEAMSNFHRYFFIMPTLARFELEIHERAERGAALTADDMNALMADLFAEGYGGEVAVDREREGITWATFGHLYTDYYVYQYATGISGAHALANRILQGRPGAVEQYLGFLKTGGARYPLEALQLAGVDLTQPEPVNIAFDILASYVERLETLVG